MKRAIVPYMPPSRTQLAITAARYAYANRAKIYKGARTIQKYYRKYIARRPRKRTRFSTRNIGERPNSETCKRFTIEDQEVLRSTRVPYIKNLCEIPQGTAIDNRLRDTFVVKGFKICMEIANLGTKPLHFNIAVLSPKQAEQVTVTDFFRGTGNTREVDFSTVLSSNDFSCRPINGDKHTVLFHKRFMLNGDNSVTGYKSDSMKTFMSFKKYQKLNRQVRVDSTTSLPEIGQCFLVYWFDFFQTPGGTASTPSTVNVYERFITYFKDPTK